METGKVNSRLLYLRRGMVDTSPDTHVQQQNGTNNKVTSCEM